jgi:hypothetical protein
VNPAETILARTQTSIEERFGASIQAGIDKWHDNSLIQLRNPDEPRSNGAANLSDLQKNEISPQRNGGGADSAFAS